MRGSLEEARYSWHRSARLARLLSSFLVSRSTSGKPDQEAYLVTISLLIQSIIIDIAEVHDLLNNCSFLLGELTMGGEGILDCRSFHMDT